MAAALLPNCPSPSPPTAPSAAPPRGSPSRRGLTSTCHTTPAAAAIPTYIPTRLGLRFSSFKVGSHDEIRLCGAVFYLYTKNLFVCFKKKRDQGSSILTGSFEKSQSVFSRSGSNVRR